MGERTILEVRAPNQTVDQIRQFLNDWFQRQKVLIDDWQATGEQKVIWRKTVRVKTTPVPGAIVVSHIGIGGAIVFDILLSQEGPNVLFHIQGYAATAGFTSGGEMSLSPNPGMLGRVPRKKGYEVMMQLFNDMSAMCGVQLQPMPAGGPMQAPQPPPQQAYQPQASPQQQPMQQPYPQQAQQQPQQQPYPQQTQQQPVPQQPQQQPIPQQPQQQPQTQQPQQQPYPQQPQQQPQTQQPQQQPYPQQPQQQPIPQQPHQQPTVAEAPTSQPNFCIHCGNAPSPGAKFCAGCGKPLG